MEPKKKTELQKTAEAPQKGLSPFTSTQAFEDVQRMAKALTMSNFIPDQYRDNLGDCMLAIEMANRIGASPVAVMQNLNVIHGRPSWSSQFIISALNSCGLFSSLRFELSGEGDAMRCYAWATDKNGEKLSGPPASIQMAKAEGWYQKKGSKWPNMPELMLNYRAAAFFGRLYAPHILSGMTTADEARDIGEQDYTSNAAASTLNQAAGVIKPKAAPRRRGRKPKEKDITAEASDDASNKTQPAADNLF